MGYSQLLQLRKDLDDRARENLLKINNLALRCQKIVQNLLSFARKQKPERTLANVNEMLERTVELRNYELSVNNIEIVRELDRSLPQTIADVHQLQQVFLNIITNAEHAMLQAHGRGSLVIRSKTDAQNGRIRVEIADDGPGIQVAHLSKIFDPFFTTKAAGKGTGLGLTVAYAIVEEHGGRLSMSSDAGGATFRVELPIGGAPLRPAAPAPPAAAEALVKGVVLVVEDEAALGAAVAEALSDAGFEVDRAGDGEEALACVKARPYDLIVCDLKMPRLDGTAFYRMIAATYPALARRIVFVTGDVAGTDAEGFLRESGCRWLPKPFRLHDLLRVAREIAG
jgi:two-component system NtrC family sensor kinase